MRASICSSCRVHLQARLGHRVALLEATRRSLHQTGPLQETGQLLTADQKPSIPSAHSGSWYWDTTPPSPVQLAAAGAFFRAHPPRKLWTATEWRKQNEPLDGSLIPEIAFLGRSNVGKSSLLNALLGSPELNYVGPRPGKTTTMHAWGLAASNLRTGGAIRGHNGDNSTKLTVIDMPGYGFASHKDWGEMIVMYLKRRKHLRRVFLLLDAMHGVKDKDKQMLDLLRHQGISHQVIASKCDRLNEAGSPKLATALLALRQAVQPMTGRSALGEILAVGRLGDGRRNKYVREQDMVGVENVQWAVLVAAGLPGFGTNVALSRAYEPQAPATPSKASILTSPPKLQSPTNTFTSLPSLRRVVSEPAPYILPDALSTHTLPERVMRIRNRHVAIEAHLSVKVQPHHTADSVFSRSPTQNMAPRMPPSYGMTKPRNQRSTSQEERTPHSVDAPSPTRTRRRTTARHALQSRSRGSKQKPRKAVVDPKEERRRLDAQFLDSHLV